MEEAIRTYQELMESIQDEKLRLFIRYILEDEKRHHNLLKRIDKIVVESETLKDSDVHGLVLDAVPREPRGLMRSPDFPSNIVRASKRERSV